MFGAGLRRPPRTGCSSSTSCATSAARSSRSFAGGAPATATSTSCSGGSRPTPRTTSSSRSTSSTTSTAPTAPAAARTLDDYVAGINGTSPRPSSTRSKMPGEYAAIGQPHGPDPWKADRRHRHRLARRRDLRQGRRQELDAGAAARRLRRSASARRGGTALWDDFRAAEDPEAPTTVHGKAFPYETSAAKRPQRAASRCPTTGSVKDEPRWSESSGPRATRSPACAPRRQVGAAPAASPLPKAKSNALRGLGRGVGVGPSAAVFGPQTGYFAPQILMEQDVHAPGHRRARRGVPGRQPRTSSSATAATTPGARPRRARTSSTRSPWTVRRRRLEGQLDSTHYMFRGQCLPMEVLERTNTWRPTRPTRRRRARETLRAERTKLGLVIARATIRGKPVAYTQLRSTYFHEVDSALGFADFNNPDQMKNAHDFQDAAYEDRLHVQLALRRRQGHRLLQLGQQPGPAPRASTRCCPSAACRSSSGSDYDRRH